ncbi:MAG: hypothetical protein ACD_20C00104G0036 [uncultured bacterium]|nr:MAG: hypothetical protein ACD_20C00104G0036 [uncultured bacterium]
MSIVVYIDLRSFLAFKSFALDVLKDLRSRLLIRDYLKTAYEYIDLR